MATEVYTLITVGIIAALALFWLFISASFLLWGARIAGIQNRSYGRAIGTIFIGGIASFVLTILLSSAPLVGTGVGILLGFCVSAVVMMSIFKTTFGKALAANLIAWVLSIVVAVGLAVVFAFLTAFLVGGA